MRLKGRQLKCLWKQKLLILIDRMAEWLNDYKVEKKLHILYICCVLFPLIVTDSVILAVVIQADKSAAAYRLENIASSVKYNFTSAVEKADTIASYIYTNQYVNDFLSQDYDSTLDYYMAYQDFQKRTLLISGAMASGAQPTMYAENDTIVNGGEFLRLDDTVKSSDWYQYYNDSGQDKILSIYFDEFNAPMTNVKRKISLIRKLDFYQWNNQEKILKLDLDYSSLARSLVKTNYEASVYICMGDQIILSNDGHSSIGKDFDTFTMDKRVGFKETFHIYGQDITICLLKEKKNILDEIWNRMPLILLLIMVNAVLPWIFMRIINRSFTGRLQELSSVFDGMEDETMQKIEDIRGNDEIGALMLNYNQMAERINDLIQKVYKGKLKEQEISIAMQKAELLALHSQINPHFLFNALESIRMHSILKGERETAHMVEKLAVMERQYVDWGSDFVTVQEEMGFVEAYLELQKYRFGDRISYSLEIEEGCQEYRIPKLTMVTFTENACVHGIEDKPTPGWIFVRVFLKEGDLYLEIEDTGNGIKEPLLSELRYKMAHAGIASLKKKGQVGIMNASLRLRMMTEDRVKFELESEDGAGTIVTIRILQECLKNTETGGVTC